MGVFLWARHSCNLAFGGVGRRGDATVAVVLDQFIIKEDVLARSPLFTLTSSRRAAAKEGGEA